MNNKLKARIENFRSYEKDDIFEGEAMNPISKNTATEMLGLINDLEKALIEAESSLHINSNISYDMCIDLTRKDLKDSESNKPISEITLYDFKDDAITIDQINDAYFISFIDVNEQIYLKRRY